MSRTIGGKMPGGFNISSAKFHLSKTQGLGHQRADTVLLNATTIEPAKRLVPKQKVKPIFMLLHKCMLNVWVSLFPLAAAAAVSLEVLPEELSRTAKNSSSSGPSNMGSRTAD
jgi:3-oxoacyl-ACP reductase-like protein